MSKIIDFGNGGFDLETVVKGDIKDMRIPATFYVQDGDTLYCGQIEGETDLEGKIVIERDSKVNAKEFHMTKGNAFEEYLKHRNLKREDMLQLIFKQKNKGQGALNSAVGRAVFLNNFSTDCPIEVCLVPIYYDEFIEKELDSLNTKYYPACKHGQVPINVNARKVPQLSKLTIRSRIEDYCGEHEPKVLKGLGDKDALFINSVKDVGFLMLAYEAVTTKKPRTYISATKSMVENVSRGVVKRIMKESEVYVAQKGELEFLLKKTVDDYGQLLEMIREAQDLMKTRDEKKARVYLTFDKEGSFALDEDGNLYYHKAKPKYDPLDFDIKGGTTSGCGDAFAAVMTSLEYLRTLNKVNYSTAEILGYAGIAGQINAKNPTTCGIDMATPKKISEHMERYPDLAQVLKYNEKQGVWEEGPVIKGM